MNRAGILAFSLILSGCAGAGMVRIPEKDPTPPAAALEVKGSSPSLKLAVGGEPVAVELGENDSLVLTGMAEDEGGLKDMLLKGNAVVTCSDPSTGATFTRPTGFLRRHVPGGAVKGRAEVRRDSRFVLRAGDFARLCRGGNLQGAVGQAGVQAANFHGGAAATPRLEFRIAMSEVSSQAIPMPALPRPSRPGAGTGLAPEPGLGGSGDAPKPPAARQCPRSAAPGRSRESRLPPPDECLDPPVPSVSPPAGTPSPASRAASPRRAAAQRTQIGKI